MSAFMTSDEHRNALLHFLRVTNRSGSPELRIYRDGLPCENLGCWTHDETWIKAAKILHDENERSLSARYKDNKPNEFFPSDYYYPFHVAPLSPVQCLKSCSCYDYQACESNDYKSTLACALVEQIRDRAIDRLDGYDAAGWGCEDVRFKRPVEPVKIICLSSLISKGGRK